MLKIEEAMKFLGDSGHDVVLSYYTKREEDKFELVFNSCLTINTDTPARFLTDFVHRERESLDAASPA